MASSSVARPEAEALASLSARLTSTVSSVEDQRSALEQVIIALTQQATELNAVSSVLTAAAHAQGSVLSDLQQLIKAGGAEAAHLSGKVQSAQDSLNVASAMLNSKGNHDLGRNGFERTASIDSTTGYDGGASEASFAADFGAGFDAPPRATATAAPAKPPPPQQPAVELERDSVVTYRGMRYVVQYVSSKGMLDLKSSETGEVEYGIAKAVVTAGAPQQAAPQQQQQQLPPPAAAATATATAPPPPSADVSASAAMDGLNIFGLPARPSARAIAVIEPDEDDLGGVEYIKDLRINGAPRMGATLTCEGEFVGEPSVQWYRVVGGANGAPLEIGGATMRSYALTADDVGCGIRVECVGPYGGDPVSAMVSQVMANPDATAELQRLVAGKKNAEKEVAVTLGGEARTLLINREKLKLRRKGKTEVKHEFSQGLGVFLSAFDECGLTVQLDAAGATSLELSCQTQAERDLVAVLLRGLTPGRGFADASAASRGGGGDGNSVSDGRSETTGDDDEGGYRDHMKRPTTSSAIGQSIREEGGPGDDDDDDDERGGEDEEFRPAIEVKIKAADEVEAPSRETLTRASMSLMAPPASRGRTRGASMIGVGGGTPSAAGANGGTPAASAALSDIRQARASQGAEGGGEGPRPRRGRRRSRSRRPRRRPRRTAAAAAAVVSPSGSASTSSGAPARRRSATSSNWTPPAPVSIASRSGRWTRRSRSSRAGATSARRRRRRATRRARRRRCSARPRSTKCSGATTTTHSRSARSARRAWVAAARPRRGPLDAAAGGHARRADSGRQRRRQRRRRRALATPNTAQAAAGGGASTPSSAAAAGALAARRCR